MDFEGRYFDGQTGLRLDLIVRLDANAQSLQLIHRDVPKNRVYWRLDQLRGLRDEARTDQLTLSMLVDQSDDSGLIDMPRLTTNDAEAIATLKRLCPDLFKRDEPDDPRNKRRPRR